MAQKTFRVLFQTTFSLTRIFSFNIIPKMSFLGSWTKTWDSIVFTGGVLRMWRLYVPQNVFYQGFRWEYCFSAPSQSPKLAFSLLRDL